MTSQELCCIFQGIGCEILLQFSIHSEESVVAGEIVSRSNAHIPYTGRSKPGSSL